MKTKVFEKLSERESTTEDIKIGLEGLCDDCCAKTITSDNIGLDNITCILIDM